MQARHTDFAQRKRGEVSAQRKVRAKHMETKGPVQMWPVTETAPGPADGTSQCGRGGYGPARAGLAIVADTAPGPGDGTSLRGRLRARVTGRAKAVEAATGPQERDWPLWLIRLRARVTGQAYAVGSGPG